MTINYYFQSGRPASIFSEQNVLEGMIIESIQISGFEAYYLPRNSPNFDKLFGEDRSSFFDRFYPIEVYLENVDGFGGDGELLSKFGIEIRETATFTVARRRWNEVVGMNDGKLILPNRPAEGDILYFPLTKSYFEIKKVDHANPFYQLGKLYVYRLNCELYQYSHEEFVTGNADIDSINSKTLDQLQYLIMDQTEQTILDEDGEQLLSDDYEVSRIDAFADNDILREQAKAIIDWSESNPFAEVS